MQAIKTRHYLSAIELPIDIVRASIVGCYYCLAAAAAEP